MRMPRSNDRFRADRQFRIKDSNRPKAAVQLVASMERLILTSASAFREPDPLTDRHFHLSISEHSGRAGGRKNEHASKTACRAWHGGIEATHGAWPAEKAARADRLAKLSRRAALLTREPALN